MDTWLQIIITTISAVLASSGFWAYMMRRNDYKDSLNKKKDLQNTMLIGLAHDRIIYLGMKYIERGWVTHDEYENLDEYLYKPYKEMGGNGTATRIMNDVSKLPIHNTSMLLKTKEVDHVDE